MLHAKSALLAAVVTILSSSGTWAHEVLRGRLVFGDHKEPVIRVLDLDTGKVSHAFSLPKANPSLTMVEGGRFVVIRTGDEAGTVRFLDTGLIRESHGDHDDIEKEDVRFLDLTFTGDRPAHVVSGEGWLSIFYDGQRPWQRPSESKALAIKIDDLGKASPHVDTWKSPAPQHGIAVPLGEDKWIISTPNPAYAKGDDKTASSRPNAFEILDKAAGWKALATYPCRLFHGHAALEGAHVFGCTEAATPGPSEDAGLLAFDGAGGEWEGTRIAYPDDRRVSAIKAGRSGKHMVANYGKSSPYRALLRIDRWADALSKADVLEIPDGQEVCQFEVAPDGSNVAQLSPDGKLRIFEIAPEWKQIAAFDAVPAFDCAYGAPTPTPRLAVIGNSAFVSDPVNGRIREFYLKTLQRGPDIAVGGMPTIIASSD